MNYDELATAARKAINAINEFSNGGNETEALMSIKAQMKFIEESAKNNIDPITQLGERKFTYAILASRELASPDELVIKTLLNDVSELLDQDQK